ncbi:MAG: DUF1722 domain-containing protein [Candidatus Schekmanbacteria bacterium]|nr:DUF1722 domain-containing protein [Candidatus Schekmanbacteria bacterium]
MDGKNQTHSSTDDTRSAPSRLRQAGAAHPRVGVSACLLGQAVRYDGAHKRDAFLCEHLAPYVEWVAVCPEAEAGLGVPREPMRLVETAPGGGPRLVGIDSQRDYTALLEAWAAARLATLEPLRLDGFVLKKRSPSCGLAPIPIYPESGGPPVLRAAAGLFAAALARAHPALPLCDEARLRRLPFRESFLCRIFTHCRLRKAVLLAPSRAALVAFHASHELLFRAHYPRGERELARLAAAAADPPPPDTLERYRAGAMSVLAATASRARHAAVLRQVAARFAPLLSPAAAQELAALIDGYAAATRARAVPLSFLVERLRRRGLARWLAGQAYFHPFPEALSPRRPSASDQ